MGDGSNPEQGFFDKVLQAGKRALSQESLFLTHYQNKADVKNQVAFAAPYPGKIIPLDLAKHGGQVICQQDAFLYAARGTQISVEFTKKLSTGFFGGEGFILQKLKGNGNAFLHACGSVCLKKLDNQELRINTGSLVAFTTGIQYQIEMVKGLKSMLFSGEGAFVTKLSGSGYVWIQSLPFKRLAQKIINTADLPMSSSDGGNKGGFSMNKSFKIGF